MAVYAAVMCGIGGIIKVTPAGEAAASALAVPVREAIPEAWLDVLDESIRHRGPDGQGRFRDRVVRADGAVVDVALVHRRLSIIDHGGGAQPMVSVRGGEARQRPRSAGPAKAARGAMTPLLFHAKPDGAVVYEGMREAEAPERFVDHSVAGEKPELTTRGDGAPSDLVAVVFNGCIYNHRELRRELLAAGHEFASDHNDTEVLLHGWREWGEGLFEKLDGMFALAIWDRLAAKLVMARDRCGEKPLYETLVVEGTRTLVFGSTVPAVIKASRAVATKPRITEITPWVLDEWVCFGSWERPPTTFVQEVQPGEHRALERHSEGEVVAITTPTPWPDRGACGPLDVVEADAILRDAARSRIESDVPLGCFLSGGVDSSLMAAFAAQALGKLRTFSVRMPDPRFDESRWAEQVAKQLGTEHVTLTCDPSPAEDLVALIHQLGVPFGDSSLLPSAWVSRSARQHVTVAIGGDGADELFGGYERYVANRWLQRYRRVLGAIPSGAFPRRSARSRTDKLARLIDAARGSGYRDLLAIFNGPTLRGLVGEHRAELNWHDEFDPLLSDIASYLPEDLMRKSDTASMSVALELRSPFLAKSVVSRCISAPLDSLMPRGQRKGLLRQVARKYFPAEIVDRPKQGFAIPIGDWFRSDYGGMKQLLMDHLESAEPWGPPRLGIELNMKFVRQMVDEHMNQRRDHSQRLYMLLVLSIWAKWMGGLS